MILSEPQFVIKKSTIPAAGKGLFTKTFIPKGTRLVEYKGAVSTWKAAKHRNGSNRYIFYVNRNHVIDGSRVKNALARYANDADGVQKMKGISNNSHFVINGLQVFIEAGKNIRAGEEILVSYGKAYWDTVQQNKLL